MGSEADPHPYSLPLFTISPPHPDPPGTSTPPLQTPVSIPFRWEEQPGKPRPCTDLIIHDRMLDLPPRLARIDPESNIKTSSPTTVLDGPGDLGHKSVFSSFSFRFAKERRRTGFVTDEIDNNGGGQMLLSSGGFRSASEKRRRDSSGLKRYRLLAKIYEGFKQVVPWRKKPKAESFTL